MGLKAKVYLHPKRSVYRKSIFRWWGWSNWGHYDYEEDAIEDAKMLESEGHIVDWYI